MWFLKDNFDGSYEAVEYKTKLNSEDKIERVPLKSKKGNLQEVAVFMLKNCEDMTVSDIELAVQCMDENGDDHASFGVLGGFTTTYTVENNAVGNA